ncbi:polyketide synthase [Streptomyces sp. NRRL B-1347]|uniref:polyketide synthase n=1 Tax=Streptomyces sp. NRRL B-1347 TaxID=1476877 RepID=UPI000691500E|nr:polyketide synthase [Streptomyces sp. NRRL B-1347]
MTSDRQARRATPARPGEPLAIVGIAELDPDGLDGVVVDVARFGIPPMQAKSMNRMQLLMLEAARRCLADAGHPERPLPAERTDVVTGLCFALDRQHANAVRIELPWYARELERAARAAGAAPDQAARAAAELRGQLAPRLGGSPHDRVGEMASTIPARIAAAFKLRGRTLAVESAEATSFVALAHAADQLRARASDAVLVLAGQRRESPFVADALAAKGVPGPGGAETDGTRDLAEGVGAVLLKRLATAVRDGDRVYATVLDCTLRHDPRPGCFRHSHSVALRQDAAADSLRAAGAAPDTVQYVECAGSAVAREAAAEHEALARLHAGRAPGTVVLGAGDGRAFAHAGLASVSRVARALHARRYPDPPPDDGEPVGAAAGAPMGAPTGAPFRRARTGEEWVAGPQAPRRAVVHGASLTGTFCHLVLEEHRGRAPAGPGARSRSGPRAVSRPVPVAVVGFGGRFAGAPDAAAFWQVVDSGRTRLGPVPDDVLDRDLYHSPGALSLTHSYTDQGGHVPVPDEPPDDLAVLPLRYAAMDGAQRLALDVAAELFAGRRGLTGRGVVAVGTTLGLTKERRAHTELVLAGLEDTVAALPALAGLSALRKKKLLERLRERTARGAAEPSPALLDGCLASGVAALLANEYGLGAVPLAVEAACASSLAALDVAVGALRSGAADFAVAGGVELACTTRDMVLCSALGLLSHSRNAPFDAAADGFTPGDGCGLFLLKRYDDARRDGDTVHGVIRAVGASNDAKSLIAPDVEGQVRAMQRAFAQVDFEPCTVDYLEAHGTGTKVGDRVEVAAAARLYAGGPRAGALRIGSAKSFFGHTFAAAGSAGLLRTLLALRAGTLPPNTLLRTLNPALGLAAIPAEIATRAEPWPRPPGRPRRAAVSSFGTGGINYHVLVEEDPAHATHHEHDDHYESHDHYENRESRENREKGSGPR